MPMWPSTERQCHVDTAGQTTVANVVDSMTVGHFAVGAAATPAALVGRRRAPNGGSNVSNV